MENRKFVVVPDGISFDKGGKAQPSFVFYQVLKYLSKILKNGDQVYLAPANHFNSGVYEQDLGHDALSKIIIKEKLNVEILVAKFYTKNNYIDTFGNAKYLLKEFPDLVNETIELVVSEKHSRRAELCFRAFQFKILKTHKVSIELKNELIVKRLWYYKYPKLHTLYEILNYIRDMARAFALK